VTSRYQIATHRRFPSALYEQEEHRLYLEGNGYIFKCSTDFQIQDGDQSESGCPTRGDMSDVLIWPPQQAKKDDVIHCTRQWDSRAVPTPTMGSFRKLQTLPVAGGRDVSIVAKLGTKSPWAKITGALGAQAVRDLRSLKFGQKWKLISPRPTTLTQN
jgi:hypothetical protein